MLIVLYTFGFKVLAGFPDCPGFASLTGVYVCFIRLRAESPAAPKRMTLAQGGRSSDLVPLVDTDLLIQPSYKHVLWASGGCFEPSWCLERNLWLQAKLCTFGLAVGRRPRVFKYWQAGSQDRATMTASPRAPGGRRLSQKGSAALHWMGAHSRSPPGTPPTIEADGSNSEPGEAGSPG